MDDGVRALLKAVLAFAIDGVFLWACWNFGVYQAFDVPHLTYWQIIACMVVLSTVTKYARIGGSGGAE